MKYATDLQNSILQSPGSSLKSFYSAATIDRGNTSFLEPDFRAFADLHLGPVSLVARDINLMLDFYVKDLELKMLERDDQTVELRPSEHDSEPLLILRHNTGAETAPNDAAGLYHYALLVPDRTSLGGTYMALGKASLIFDGYADHQVSEALYLTDPEGNGSSMRTAKWRWVPFLSTLTRCLGTRPEP